MAVRKDLEELKVALEALARRRYLGIDEFNGRMERYESFIKTSIFAIVGLLVYLLITSKDFASIDFYDFFLLVLR